MAARATVLIIEDGAEYLENLRRFVRGPVYRQAHDAAEALAVLETRSVDLIYLDMRFDRIARGRLVGDHHQATLECNGDGMNAWRFLQDNRRVMRLVQDFIHREEQIGHILAQQTLAVNDAQGAGVHRPTAFGDRRQSTAAVTAGGGDGGVDLVVAGYPYGGLGPPARVGEECPLLAPVTPATADEHREGHKDRRREGSGRHRVAR